MLFDEVFTTTLAGYWLLRAFTLYLLGEAPVLWQLWNTATLVTSFPRLASFHPASAAKHWPQCQSISVLVSILENEVGKYGSSRVWMRCKRD